MHGARRRVEEEPRPERKIISRRSRRLRIPACVAFGPGKHFAMLTATSKPKARTRVKRLADRRWTFDELAAEVPESNQPTELWDGELIMPPSPSFFHQEISDRFHDFLKAWTRKHQLGKTAVAPLDMVLTEHRVTQPDVVFISKQRL